MNDTAPSAAAQRTLLSRVMTGVLSLLGVGGILVTIAAFAYGENAARKSFDRILVGAANDIAESINIMGGVPKAAIPASAFALLALAADDRISYAVHDPSGQLLTGYDDLQLHDVPISGRETQVFFDSKLQGEQARFVTVARRFSEREFSGSVFVTVGQTMLARKEMALDLAKGAVIATGLGGIALVISAFLVIRSAMRPLRNLADELSRRDPYDLTPMPTEGPAEVAVMILAMNRFIQRLDRQVGAMKNLISDTAHQLRTPVAAIRAQAELALEDDPPQRDQRLDRLVRRTRSLGTLLDQMLSRAMVIHRTDNARPAQIDLRDVALKVLEDRDHEVLAPDVEVQLQISDNAVVVVADEISLCEAVKNMLTNALRHGRSPIVIGVSAQDTQAQIWVEDSGKGPTADILATIGQRFERSAASRGNSAGLGLSIVRAVAEAFGGDVGMSHTNKGFRVTLSLPTQSQERGS